MPRRVIATYTSSVTVAAILACTGGAPRRAGRGRVTAAALKITGRHEALHFFIRTLRATDGVVTPEDQTLKLSAAPHTFIFIDGHITNPPFSPLSIQALNNSACQEWEHDFMVPQERITLPPFQSGPVNDICHWPIMLNKIHVDRG